MRAAGSIAIVSPSPGATVRGPVRITGTFDGAYDLLISFDAGPLSDVHLEDPDGDESGTWYYDWNPAGHSGAVEIRVRGSSVDDRYWDWGAPVTVAVAIAAQQPPAVAILGPGEGVTATGTVPITVAASDADLAGVQVRVDWGPWRTAAPSGGGQYVYQWNTAGQGDKTHAIEARATDAAGNAATTSTRYVKTGAGTRELPAVKHADRAFWLWPPAAFRVLGNAGSIAVLEAFMEDPAIGVPSRRTIYLFADRHEGTWPLLDDPSSYRSFIAWAHSRGYFVHALLASGAYNAPMYAYPRYHGKAVALMEAVLNYNIGSAFEERFDGVNIDIEPYTLGDWVTAAPTVQSNYLDMLDGMMQRKAASGQNVAVGAAIPRWLDVAAECLDVTWRGTSQNCARHVQDIVDYVALMDYRDEVYDGGGGGIIPDAQNELNYASAIGKYVVIGVETGQISASGDPERISFQEEGRTYMEEQLAQVYSYYHAYPGFAGIAVHHYDSDRALPSRWSSGGTIWRSTIPDLSAPGAPTGLTATAWDWQRIDLRWQASPDDVEVDHYRIHRGTSAGFTPSAANHVRSTKDTSAEDWGLVAGRSYYYRIVAVDAAGRSSAPSAGVRADTPAGVGLSPMWIQNIAMQCTPGGATATISVARNNGALLDSVKVVGHWEGAAGAKFSGLTPRGGSGKGKIATTSEALARPFRALVMPERLKRNGYYWAWSQDVVHGAQIDCN